MAETKHYFSTFAGKGARLSDIKTVLAAVASGKTVNEVRASVIEDDLLDRGTRKSRETAWKEIHRRYSSGRPEGYFERLARMVSHNANPIVQNLVLFYEYCQTDTLLYDLSAYCTYDLYQNARTVIDQVDVNEWLIQQEGDHPEIKNWSPSTRHRLVAGYLATIRDFGLVTGNNQKEFYKLYVPREAFVYALYHQKERGIEGKTLIESPDWRLFLLSQPEVVFMLEDAARGGFVHFRYAGDIYDLRFIYNDLREVVDALTGG